MINNPIGSIVGLGVLPQTGWWQYPRVDNLGAPDPFGGFPKPDSNIQLPDNYPVDSILSGTVSGINNPNGPIDAWGAAVTIKLDQPLNTIATHIAYLHLATVTVRMGQHVNVGDRIGYNGGNAAAGSQKVPLGVALYNGDYYGHDGWQYETSQNLRPGGPLDIVPLLNSAASGTLQTSNYYGTGMNTETSNSVLAFLSNASSLVQNTVQLTPTSDVIAVLEAIDTVMQFENPIDAIKSDSNLLDWIPELLYALALDFSMVVIRLIFLMIGLYMCFRVINQVTNLSGIVAKGADIGLSVAEMAAVGA